MKRITVFFVFGTIASLLSILTACDNQQVSAFETIPPNAKKNLLDSNMLINTGDKLVDSLYTEFLHSDPDMDPDIALRIARNKAAALQGEAILLSLYEVKEFPAEKAPSTSHMQLSNSKGIFYFVLPVSLCGYTVFEEKYFKEPSQTFLICGSNDSLL